MLSKKDWEKHVESLKTDEVIDSQKTAVETIKKYVVEAVKKNAPKEKFGVLFSGGVDSTLIAFILKEQGFDFVCYSVGFEDVGQKESDDLIWAKKIAKKYGFKIKTITLDFKNVEKILKKTVKILGSKLNNIVNVGVGAVAVAAIIEAEKDGIKHFFSGLGSEEIFAGYQRHEQANDKNAECWRGLAGMYEIDILRDNVISKHFDVKFITPFLDEQLIREAMKIPAKFKIKGNDKKLVLRHSALELGLDKEFAFRQKKAAQYGSRINNAIGKLAKKNGFKYKKEYLKSLE